MGTSERDAPGVLALPPLIYGTFLVLGLALDYAAPVPLLPDAPRYTVGSTLILASAVVVLAALREFRRARTSFDVRQPATARVTTGPYRFSRNPASLALTPPCVGIAVAADSIWVLGLLVPIILVMHNGVILREGTLPCRS